MKTFCYKTPDGVVHDIDALNYDEMMARECRKGVIVLDDGREATRDICAEQNDTRHATGAGWPLELWMEGVHPSQHKELNEHLVANGCAPVELSKKGGPMVESPKHYRDFLRARGKFDRDGVRSPRNV